MGSAFISSIGHFFFLEMLSRLSKLTVWSNVAAGRIQMQMPKLYSSSVVSRGFEEFFDQKEEGDEVITGRSWTAADLRRKSFDDLHKLWYVLYKERNLLLSERERARRNSRPIQPKEETRYLKVKRSMGAIKFVLSERSKIHKLLKKEGVEGLADTKPPQTI